MSILNTFKSHLLESQAKHKILQENLVKWQGCVLELDEENKLVEEANLVIQTAARLTQEQLQHRISDTVTLALAAVFPDPYEFKVEFVERRSSTECDLFFTRRGEDMKPLEDSGFGAADVASFALRFSCWRDSGSRPVLIFDEPFRQLSVKYREPAARMVKMLSEKLGIQIIMVTHIQELQLAADKVFEVSCSNDIAEVREV